MKTKAIIWDLDGTLMDTLQDLFLAVNHALELNGMPVCSFEHVRRSVGNGVRRLMVLCVPGGEENPLFEKAFADFREYYMAHCEDNTRPYDGVREVLSLLKAKGYRMAIVSNKLQEGVTELYKRYFEGLIDVPIGERKGIARKPAADMVELALGELGVERDEAVYVGDSEVDLMTAYNASLPCIAVLWGFRTREELQEAESRLGEGRQQICYLEKPELIPLLLEPEE